MKSKITALDIFALIEMMSEQVELEMSVKAYQKILGTCGSIEPKDITNIQNTINGKKINFNNTLNEDVVKFYAKYIPHATEIVEIKLV